MSADRKPGQEEHEALSHAVRQLVSDGVIRLRWHARLEQAPQRLPTDLDLADKVEGMMLGLAIGDALGNTSESMTPSNRGDCYGWIENYLPNRHANRRSVGLPSDDTQLAYWTLEHLLRCGHLDPVLLGRQFASRQEMIFGIGRATCNALSRIDAGVDWPRCGAHNAGNGALMRIAPILLPHLWHPSSALWTDVLAAAHLTHDDELSNASCIAFVDLLWCLLGSSAIPNSDWWLAHWIEVNADVGSATRYAARSEHPPGFDGTINELLEGYVRPALAQNLAVETAGNIWHSGAYLLETVPSVLYILARHGHDPVEAIEHAVNGTHDNDTAAAIVGAAVGALHGARAFPQPWIDGLLGRTGERDDGAVFRLLAAAGAKFGYGTSAALRQRAAATRTGKGRDADGLV